MVINNVKTENLPCEQVKVIKGNGKCEVRTMTYERIKR